MTERSSLARRNLPPIRRPPHGEKPLLFAGLHGMKRPEARREESLAGAMQLSAVPDRRVRDFLPCPIAASATFGRLAARRHLHTRPSLGDAGIRNDACRPLGHPGPGHPGPGHTGRAHRPGTPAGHTGRPHRPGHTGPATLARPLAVLELFAEPGIILSAIVPSGIAGAAPDQTRDRRCSTKRPLGASPGHPCPVRRGLRHGTKNLKPARPSTQKKATPLPALGITRRPCGVPLLLSLNLFIIELEIEELKVAGPGPSRKGGDPVRVHC